MKKIYRLNQNWKFQKVSELKIEYQNDYFNTYKGNTKTGLLAGAISSSFCDEEFKTVTLPHDWTIEERPDENFTQHQGNRPQGVVIYKKHFLLDKEFEEKRIFLQFDGIATASEIYFNDIKIAESKSGYTPIFVEVTDFAYFDRNNTISVRADSTIKEGYWYEGGGIYRNTYLIIKEKNHFKNDGVFVNAKRIKDNQWDVFVEIDSVKDENCFYEVEIENKTVKSSADKFSFEFSDPILWDSKNPHLYEVTIRLRNESEIFDEEKINFGFREFYFDKDNGFNINGKFEKIKGVCLHHDHCGVGVAVDKNILEYRMKKLKEMGCNAVRTAHNPQSKEFYDVCDRFGFYVMDEARHFSSTEIILKELEILIKRDRNHPCVILWSLFNEEPLQCTSVGEKIITSMINTVQKFDTTRPISGGMNGPLEINGVVKHLDVVGFNYLQYGYDEFHCIHPDIPIIGSENGSYLSSRDEYESNPETSKLSCYKRVLGENLYHWSDTPGGTWEYICQRPFVAGCFYWSGIDYYGETGTFYWPGITCNFGAMDICGFEKDVYYWLKALWREEPVLEVPRMWDGIEGEKLDMICYSNCDTVEFICNGKSLGEKQNNMFDPEIIPISYEKGELKVIGKNNGKIVCEKILYSYSNEHTLEINISKEIVRIGENTVCNIALKDAYGQVVKNNFSNVKIRVNGGEVVGSGNGDSANHNSKSDVQPLFHGLAQFIIRVDGDEVFIEAECNDIIATKSLKGIVDDGVPFMKSVSFKSYGYDYRISDIHPAYPSKEQMIDPFFTWIPTAIHNEKSLMMSGKEGFATVSCNLNIPKADKNIYLVIEQIRGDFDICLCGEKVYSANYENCTDIKIECNQLKNFNKATMQLIFKLHKSDCGISGNIYCY